MELSSVHIAVTGGTGFLGNYIVKHFVQRGDQCRVWCHSTSNRSSLTAYDAGIEWVEGRLGDSSAAFQLVQGCDAVIHAALDLRGSDLGTDDEDLVRFAESNIIGTLRLITEARAAGVPRFVCVSSCAVHEKILDDRTLDETHPLWPTTHYGAHKAAIEKFVHSFGLGKDYPICAVRPVHIYGLANPAAESTWYELVRSVVKGDNVECRRGGKCVHAGDVAKACDLLLGADADAVRGEVFACCDRYISEHEVAQLVKQLTGSASIVTGTATAPRHQIDTRKLTNMGMQFGGQPLLRGTIEELVNAVSVE
jgi:nucleoside-diphosphate-sugar epimerase